MEPTTASEVLAAFEDFVLRQEHLTGARSLSRGQREGLHVAIDALEDIIAGRMSGMKQKSR